MSPGTTAPSTAGIARLRPDAAAAEPIERVGGKGAALHALIRAGLPVPPAVVVTTAAYEEVVAGDDGLRAFLEACPDDDAAVDARFVGTAPPALRQQIIMARNEIDSRRRPVVVRSSATTEDLGGASFAGQYRSVIGARTDDEVVAAVEQVWASLWHVAPRTYRLLHGLDATRVAMAVIIQPMVESVTAGVVFTSDPAGDRAKVRVERVHGQGEGLVSGDLTPEVFLVDRETLQSAEPDVRRAAQLALAAEAEFGSPQDVEWAQDGARLWVVQSRPITTAAPSTDDDGFDSPIESAARYTTAGIAEMLPGVLPPLHWSTAGFMIEHAFSEVLDRLGGFVPDEEEYRPFLVRVRGRAALDLDRLAAVAERLPGGSPEELERQFLGTTTARATPPAAPSLRQRVGHDLRVLAANRRARSEQGIVAHAVDAVLRTPVDPGSMPSSDLLTRRARLVDLGVRTAVAELAVAAAAVAAFGRLESRLVRHLGADEGRRWALHVTRGLHTETVLDEVGGLAAGLAAAVPDLWSAPSWAAAQDRLHAAGRADLVASIEDAAARAGSRRLPGGPSWSEDLDAFWRLVQAAGAGPVTPPDPHRDLDELVELLKATPGWQRRRWLTGQVIDSRLIIVRRLARDAVDLLGRRETAKATLLELGGRIRLIDLELGLRLGGRGALLHPLDIDHLAPGEIAGALTGPAPVDLETVLRRRRCVERWRSESDLPLSFEGRPEAAEPPVPTGDRLQGWSASGGRHTGPVRCLDAPTAGAVQPGDVVVARRTDASWSPVFLRAAAVVVEEGGPLSHAAIVARELGLPAVVNVPGIVARLRTERRPVTVDGDAGLVLVHEEAERGATAS